MRKFISLFLLLIFFSIANADVTADCLEKIDKIYASEGQKADFIAGPGGTITIAGEGPTKIYSSQGLVTIDGLGCKMDRSRKIPEAIGDVFYRLIVHMQTGLTPTDNPRKAIFKNTEIARKINEAAILCRQISSNQMDASLKLLTLNGNKSDKSQPESAR